MKKYVFAALALVCALACSPKKEEAPKVMARAVPERADDFVFENDLIAGRFYGKALEGNPTSPGLDIWVKMPGQLVANDWYEHAVNEDPDYYHHNHGGKDCYKVAVSLGGGASAPIFDGELIYPATNYRSYEILEETPTLVRFALDYPAWDVNGVPVSLRKVVSLEAGSYFANVTDYYSYPDSVGVLTVAAGFKLHNAQGTVEKAHRGVSRYAIWEHASDQSIEPEDGMIGVALIAPSINDRYIGVSYDQDHVLFITPIRPGEPLRYRIGSCWSKGDIKTAEDWFKLVDEQ